MIGTIDPARDENRWRAYHAVLGRGADERLQIVMFEEIPIIVAIRQVRIRRPLCPRCDEQAAIGLDEKEGVCLRQVVQPLAEKVLRRLGAEERHELVGRDDAETGDTRLHLRKGKIDHLDITRCLLGQYHAEVRHRDPILFDDLAVQVPDRNTAAKQRDDAESDANCP